MSRDTIHVHTEGMAGTFSRYLYILYSSEVHNQDVYRFVEGFWVMELLDGAHTYVIGVTSLSSLSGFS